MFDNEHANQGTQCSSVQTYTLVVHNIALYRLGGAQDDFACLLSIFFYAVQCSVVSLCVCVTKYSIDYIPNILSHQLRHMC